MTKFAHDMPKKGRPLHADAVPLRAMMRGTQCPIERAGHGMTQATRRPLGDASGLGGVGGDFDACIAGLAPGTLILTLDGELPVEFLTPGDRVITRRGLRRLKAVARHMLSEGATRVRVTAEALGGKPARDIIVMPEQRIVLRDWRAQALWGKDIAAIPAARLVDGTFIRTETGAKQTMLSLSFGAPEILYADGLELASADKPMVAATAH